MEEGQTYDIYYDEMGDFLEITFGAPPNNEGTEQIESGVFITKNIDTNEVYGIGILNFKKRAVILGRILSKFNKSLPIKISI